MWARALAPEGVAELGRVHGPFCSVCGPPAAAVPVRAAHQRPQALRFRAAGRSGADRDRAAPTPAPASSDRRRSPPRGRGHPPSSSSHTGGVPFAGRRLRIGLGRRDGPVLGLHSRTERSNDGSRCFRPFWAHSRGHLIFGRNKNVPARCSNTSPGLDPHLRKQEEIMQKSTGRHRKPLRGWRKRTRWLFGVVLAAVLCSPLQVRRTPSTPVDRPPRNRTVAPAVPVPIPRPRRPHPSEQGRYVDDGSMPGVRPCLFAGPEQALASNQVVDEEPGEFDELAGLVRTWLELTT